MKERLDIYMKCKPFPKEGEEPISFADFDVDVEAKDDSVRKQGTKNKMNEKLKKMIREESSNDLCNFTDDVNYSFLQRWDLEKTDKLHDHIQRCKNSRNQQIRAKSQQ
jgi:hypothetical protein